jgi:quercetin dioxygenase-like cupin family protein
MNSVANIHAGVGSFDSLPSDEPFPGVRRNAFSTGRATVTRYSFEPRASFPLHSHPQEQVTLVESGVVEMTIAGETHRLMAGEWSVISADVEHGITAGPSGARIVAVISPPRGAPDEYKVSRGNR